MHVWIQNNPSVRVDFAKRARGLVPFGRETVNFLLLTGAIVVRDEAIAVGQRPKRISTLAIGGEVKECFKAAEIVGRWFRRAGSAENIFTMWGVMP